MSSEELKENAILMDAIRQQVDTISNVSENLRKAIPDAIISHKQSERNLAYCASHVQRAVNAVISLASDLASINSLMQAGDSNNQTTKLFHRVFKQIISTGNKAETAAQLAMDASMLNAQLSFSLVEVSAQNLHEDLFDLMKIHFSQPNSFLSELSVKPYKIMEFTASGKINSQAGKAHLSYLQPMIVLLQNELQIISQFQNPTKAGAMYVDNRFKIYDQVCMDIRVLKKSLITAQSELLELNLKVKSLTQKMKAINMELNNAKDSYTRFFDMIRKRKAINPLISDDLISCCEKAQNDLVSAIKQSFKALKFTIAAGTESFS